MNVEISKMNKTDYEQIKQNLVRDFDDFWTISSLETEMQNKDNYFAIAKEDDTIVGFAGMMMNYDCTEILNIVVHKKYRRQGIASKLLEHLIEYSKQHEKQSIMLEVNVQNEIALGLYKKYNFEEVGKRKKYYNNQDDAILMTLFLE